MCEKTYNNNKEKILTEDFSDNEDMDNSKNFFLLVMKIVFQKKEVQN